MSGRKGRVNLSFRAEKRRTDAIQAALYPDETYLAENYLYFCAKDPERGELHFSRTLEEHNQAVAIYAPLWKQYDESRGIE